MYIFDISKKDGFSYTTFNLFEAADSRSLFLPILDLGPRIQKQQQKKGVKKNLCCRTFFVATKFYKIDNYFIFEVLKKKIWTSFQRNRELFTQKFVTNLLKIWV
jgi:hypothetical protein